MAGSSGSTRNSPFHPASLRLQRIQDSLASYKGVLIGATTIPVWSQNREILPPHFLTSGLGSSSGILELRIAGFVEGPASLLLGLFLGGSHSGRYAAAICFIVGALLNRFGWIWVGRTSAQDPHALFQLQHIAIYDHFRFTGSGISLVEIQPILRKVVNFEQTSVFG
jgi:hypothetical protein